MKTSKGVSSLVGEVYFALCKSVDSPRSLGAWLRFRFSHLELSQFEVRPEDYLDSDSFEKDYFIASFLSKWKGLDTGVDLEEVALQKFTHSEEICRETNKRIIQGRHSGFPRPVEQVLWLARRKVASLLGPFSVFKVVDEVGWGPGATDDLRRRHAQLDLKMSKVPISVSTSALPVLAKVVEDDLHWSSALLKVDPGTLQGPYSLLRSTFRHSNANVVTTVPKNAKTHRVIAMEPRGNGFLQKGVGAYLRRRLKSVGVDLDDQQPNQSGARRAYSEGLATLDLRAASDTVSLELVYELLPVDWAIYLDELRSRYSILPNGSMLKLEKFSSMGNGFTFELESLIFWAICSSCIEQSSGREELLVYGDDLVVPREDAPLIIDVLGYVGFATNRDKSFVDGNFFESCGKHFFKGVEVTPVYQKELVDSVCEQIRLANRLMRSSVRFGSSSTLCPWILPAWNLVWRAARRDRSFVFQIPLGTEGDDGYLVNGYWFDRVRWDANLGFSCHVLTFAPKRLPAAEEFLLAWTLRSGTVVETPYEGLITVPPGKADRVRPGRRWVMPTGDFGYE